MSLKKRRLILLGEGLGPNLVVNGTFDADATWAKGTGWTIPTPVAHCDGTQVAVTNLTQNIAAVVVGNPYLIEFIVSNFSAGLIRTFFSPTTGGLGPFIAGDGLYRVSLEAGGTLFAIQGNAALICDIDDVKVRAIL